jgi:hypothetical protein
VAGPDDSLQTAQPVVGGLQARLSSHAQREGTVNEPQALPNSRASPEMVGVDERWEPPSLPGSQTRWFCVLS